MLLSLHENISKKIPKIQAEEGRKKEKKIGNTIHTIIRRLLKKTEQDVSHIHFNRAYQRRKMMRHATVSRRASFARKRPR